MNGAAFASEKGSPAIEGPALIGLLLVLGFLLDFAGGFVRRLLHFVGCLLSRLGSRFPRILGSVTDVFAGLLDVAAGLFDVLSRGLRERVRSGTKNQGTSESCKS